MFYSLTVPNAIIIYIFECTGHDEKIGFQQFIGDYISI